MPNVPNSLLGVFTQMKMIPASLIASPESVVKKRFFPRVFITTSFSPGSKIGISSPFHASMRL